MVFDLIVNDIKSDYSGDQFLTKIFLVVLKRLESGCQSPFDLGGVSEDLCVSKRTLYRRLKDHGKTYFDVKDEVRKRYALYLISLKELNVEQLSRLLFFNNTSYFIQSFKRWHGYTPKKWVDAHPEIKGEGNLTLMATQ